MKNSRAKKKMMSSLSERARISSKSAKCETSASLIRKQLFNLELEITRVSSEMDFLDETIKANQFNKGTRAKRKAISASNRYGAYKQYLERLTDIHDELLKEVEKIISKYEGPYKEIFEMAFIERGYTMEKIAEKLNYDYKWVQQTISAMANDLSKIM